MSIQESNEILSEGGYIHDEDLQQLYNHYHNLVKGLTPLGAEFQLARNELIKRRDKVESYITARAFK